jgi:PncC family amidohydrolase
VVVGEIFLNVKELEKIFVTRGWTLATAESCTGGLLSALIVEYPGVSSFFRGAVVSYARDAKIDVLKVPSHLIAAIGEVSLPVALSMAQGVRRTLRADWGVSITGIAGPSGGSKEKPVGTVCFGVVGPGFERTIQKQFQSKAKDEALRKDIQRQSAVFAFDFLLSAIR